MKILSLNTWGGRAGREGLLSFFKKYRDEVDVFCLQEIWAAAYKDYEGKSAGGVPITQSAIMTEGLKDISEILPNHVPYFRPHFLDSYGLLMMVKKDLTIRAEGELFVFKEKGHIPEGDIGKHARNIQYVTIEKEDTSLTVVNFHGLWNGKGKGDSADRLTQSEKILDFLKDLDHPFVLCGDFNLLPDTQSLKKFQDFGLTNLIAKYNISSTRTSLYTKPEKFADYVFASKEISILNFGVLPDEVSDHAPLLLEVE